MKKLLLTLVLLLNVKAVFANPGISVEEISKSDYITLKQLQDFYSEKQRIYNELSIEFRNAKLENDNNYYVSLPNPLMEAMGSLMKTTVLFTAGSAAVSLYVHKMSAVKFGGTISQYGYKNAALRLTKWCIKAPTIGGIFCRILGSGAIASSALEDFMDKRSNFRQKFYFDKSELDAIEVKLEQSSREIEAIKELLATEDDLDSTSIIVTKDQLKDLF